MILAPTGEKKKDIVIRVELTSSGSSSSAVHLIFF